MYLSIYLLYIFMLLYIYVTVNVIELVIMHIYRLLCIISSPISPICILFMLNGKFEYQIDYLSQ